MQTFPLRLVLLASMLFPLFAYAQDAAPAQPQSVMGIVLQGLVALGGLALTVLLAVASMAIASRTKDSRFGGLINQLWVIVQSTVAHAEAEIRPKLQKALEDGKLSPEEASALKAEVLRIVKESASAQIGELVKGFKMPEGLVSNVLSGLVERAVAVLKSTSSPSPTIASPASPTPPIAPPR